MFESLTEKLGKIFSRLGNKGKLTEKDVDDAMREIRLALLEADVNFKVVKEFITRVRERSVGSAVLESLTPGQQIVKIVNEELINILGGGQSKLNPAGHPPSIIMLVGLQGSGKTTTAAKLALNLKRSGQSPLLVAADTRRPAAIQQLVTLGKQLDIPVFSEDTTVPVKDICLHALTKAKQTAASWVILDTAGRLHIDQELMGELEDIKRATNPNEILLVVDSMTGQDAVRVAEDFNNRVNITGLILTKLDGDARGGAALSIRWVAKVPIKYIGTGEKLDQMEAFYPERLASRILGMGDMLTLIEKAEQAFDKKKAVELQKKLEKATYDLEDFLTNLKEVRKMGSLTSLVSMVPGLSRMANKIDENQQEKQLKKVEAIILSMTPWERRNPNGIDGSRKRRIAAGSGTQTSDINQLLNQFRQMQKLMKMGMKGKLNPDMLKMFR
ncbi:MAG TPA: signal recognition particle protein [Dehalococcoidales bacterium]|nr:signal recognition particle protein [Dehalococcoidales bacterium]